MAILIPAALAFFLFVPLATATEVSYARIPYEAIHLSIPAPKASPSPVQVDIKKLIACESGGKNIARIDSNGKYSYGILQFQQSTWDDFSQLSGIKGNPMNESDAIKMATWAIEHGFINRWTCARILHLSTSGK